MARNRLLEIEKIIIFHGHKILCLRFEKGHWNYFCVFCYFLLCSYSKTVLSRKQSRYPVSGLNGYPDRYPIPTFRVAGYPVHPINKNGRETYSTMHGDHWPAILNTMAPSYTYMYSINSYSKN
jgi:hypothetical protein